MARIQLNEDSIEKVVGGAFQFYSGGCKCKVGGQKYTCDASAQFQVITLINNNPDKTEAELVEMAVSQGILIPV